MDHNEYLKEIADIAESLVEEAMTHYENNSLDACDYILAVKLPNYSAQIDDQIILKHSSHTPRLKSSYNWLDDAELAACAIRDDIFDRLSATFDAARQCN